MEALKVSKADIVLYVHPSKSNKVPEAILRELSSLLFKFSETFDGVLLAYDVNMQENKAKILSGTQPYFGVRLKAELLLFTPMPDMLLEGKVVKLAQESIHVVVLGFSSAIIIEENIRKEFKYKIKHGEGRFASTAHNRHVIKVGATIRFLIKSFDEEILHFCGSLLPPSTGNVCWLDKPLENDLQVDRSINKHREKNRRNAMEHDDHQSKKSKRHYTVEES